MSQKKEELLEGLLFIQMFGQYGGCELVERPQYVFQSSDGKGRSRPVVSKVINSMLRLGWLAKKAGRLELTAKGRKATKRHMASFRGPHTKGRPKLIVLIPEEPRPEPEEYD